MAKLLEKVFKNKEAKGKGKGRNWLKLLGITSSVIWVAAMGGVYALKDMSLAPADTHDKDGQDEKAVEAHGSADEHHAAEAGQNDKGHGKAEGHHADQAKEAKHPEVLAGDPGETEDESSEIQPPATQDERNAWRELAEIHASRATWRRPCIPCTS